VTTQHPLRVRLPGFGLPTHAQSEREQWLYRSQAGVVVKEVNRVAGVPFSERFEVRPPGLVEV
jgi:hypothetical protein